MKIGVVTAVSFAVACTTILGDLEVGPDTGLTNDSGTLDSATQTQGQHDSGDDAASTKVLGCETAADCTATPMTPAACAAADCVDHKCVYTAVDGDGDGHKMAGCVVDGNPIDGDDCADDIPTVFPGGTCLEQADGTPITFPNGTPTGACKAGAWQCTGGKPVCSGAVLPAPAENCTLKNDANCNGVPDDGCDCTPNTTGPCGNVNNLPAPCQAGTRTCSPAGKWGACSGNVEPKARDCSSTTDNDCNGAADRGEAACNCPGGVPQGKDASCTVPGALGDCADGTWTCKPNGSTGAFGACSGPKPQAINCKLTNDANCNGSSDTLEPECGSPCLDRLGSGNVVAGAQRFTVNMWGCAAVRNFPARAAGCAAGWSVCTAAQWAAYIRGASPKAPTHKYWLAEKLNYGGTLPACYAPASGGSDCGGTDQSMAVCPYAANGSSVTDAENNVCNWSGCTFGSSYSTNDYIGGCSGNLTAGTLCCK